MTLTADPRARTAVRGARSGSTVTAPPALPSAGPTLVTVLVLDDVYRVLDDGRTVGYVQLAGPIFVSLLGEVYNTSVEVAQCFDLESAVDRLQRARE